MYRPTLYSEVKNRKVLSLTPTAVEWLETQRVYLSGRSTSDVIELLARGAMPVQPGGEPDQLD